MCQFAKNTPFRCHGDRCQYLKSRPLEYTTFHEGLSPKEGKSEGGAACAWLPEWLLTNAASFVDLRRLANLRVSVGFGPAFVSQ